MIVNSSLNGVNMHREKIAANMAEMERLGIEIQRVAVIQDGSSAGRLIAFRRQYSQAVQNMTNAAEAGLSYLPVEQSETLSVTFRKMLSNVRAAVAAHQSHWPAVTIAHDSAAYAESSRHVTVLQQALVSWLRQNLLPAFAG